MFGSGRRFAGLFIIAAVAAGCGSATPSSSSSAVASTIPSAVATVSAAPSASPSASPAPSASVGPFDPYGPTPAPGSVASMTFPARTVFVQLFEWKWTDVAQDGSLSKSSFLRLPHPST